LLSLPNVVHIPHLGASTREAERDVGIQIANQVVSALRGADFSYAVNMPFQVEGGFAAVRPYLILAETLGRLQAGLADKPVKRVEVEAHGDVVGGLVRAIGAGLLKGLVESRSVMPVNYINAPTLAHELGITTTQTVGLNDLDYPNLVACRAIWDGGERMLAGVLFGGSEPRVVQVDDYRLEARPEGIVLVMQNKDVPGVIGHVGTLLADHGVNIGEWRLGRNKPGGEAVSFINLDGEPSEAVLEGLRQIDAVTQVKVVRL
jgi:D-3-phosphoglycerate dehydrogenase